MSADEFPMGALPVLTEVVQTAPEGVGSDLHAHMVRALPGLVRDALEEVQPQLEQQLLDALMPKLLAAAAGWPTSPPQAQVTDGPRLP